ncbi:MAG: type sorting protein, partial [Bacteroidota bacterium]|nr:type sorting protein [Bacteroidota bacterium]
MKRLFALMLFIGLSLAAAAQTPLILDRSSFNYSTDNDSVIVSPTPFSFNTPQEGANMIWDYSNIQKGSTVSYGIFGNNTQRFLNFPLISVDGFEYITATRGYFSDSYYNINDQYYAWTASYVKPQSYFIGDLSGNENDTLSFPGGEYELETPSYYIKFPSTFQSAFSYNTKWLTDFVLTVTNFGINKANGQKKKYYSVSDSVVG